MAEAAPDTLTYHAQLSTSAEGWPYVLEVACGWPTTTHRPGRHLTGLNWTPSLRVPFASWRSLVSQYRIDSHDPLSLVVHLACPVVPVTDRAKSQVVTTARSRQPSVPAWGESPSGGSGSSRTLISAASRNRRSRTKPSASAQAADHDQGSLLPGDGSGVYVGER